MYERSSSGAQNRKREKNMKNLKTEYKPGGKNRQYILDKAVDYITSKGPGLGTQGDRHHFLLEKVGLTETEYLECLNKASNGALEDAWKK